MMAAALEDVQEPDDVAVDVRAWGFDRGTDTHLSGEVNDECDVE